MRISDWSSDVCSSDLINGEKYFISGAGDPRCKILICMVKTNPEAARKAQHSQILVPMDTPGVQVLGPMRVFGADHAPQGHMHMRFDNVRVPRTNFLQIGRASWRDRG